MRDRRSCGGYSRLSACLAGLVVALVVAGQSQGAVGVYGDIEITPDIEPRGNPTHGYTEYRFAIKNKSVQREVRVTLQLPGDSGRRYVGGSIYSITRTVEVGPGGVTTLSLLQPSTPDIAGGNVAVYINGRKQENLLTVPIVAGYTPSGVLHSRTRRYRAMPSSTGVSDALVLTSLRVPEDFFKTTNLGLVMPGGGFRGGMVPGGGGPPGLPEEPDEKMPEEGKGGVAGVRGRGPLVPRPGYQSQRSDLPVSIWSTNWLAYSRYDAIVLTTDDLEDLQRGGAETRDVLTSLWQYVETGGVMLVLGKVPVGKKEKLPAMVPPQSYARPMGLEWGIQIYSVGFGRCLVAPDREGKSWTDERWSVINAAARSTATVWQNSKSINDLNKAFPVVTDLGVPVKGLFAMMVVFAITMGPLNLHFLSRYKKRIWLLWTVPVLAMVFCFAVLGYMVIGEGWQGHSLTAGVTLLDEVEKRATTLGRAGFYSPLTPGDGLRFSDHTEVGLLGNEHSAWNNACSVDWSDGQQHLNRGWIAARVPAYFSLRKSEILRRERLNITQEEDGTLSVVNALGADIEQLWVVDQKNGLYRADEIGAGDRAKLTRKGIWKDPKGMREGEARAFEGQRQPAGVGIDDFGGAPGVLDTEVEPWRYFYSGQDWVMAMEQMRTNPQKYLRPGMYLAVVKSSPFLETGLKGARQKQTESVVLGVSSDLAAKR